MEKADDIVKGIMQKAINEEITARTYIPKPFGEKNLFVDVIEITADRIKRREYVNHSLTTNLIRIQNNDFNIFPVGNKRYSFHPDDEIIAPLGTLLNLKDLDGKDILLVMQPGAIERLLGNWIYNFKTQSINLIKMKDAEIERLQTETKRLSGVMQDMIGQINAMKNQENETPMTGGVTFMAQPAKKKQK